MANKRRTRSSGFTPSPASRRPASTERDEVPATEPDGLTGELLWTEPDAVADLAGTDEFVLPPSPSREHWPVLGSDPALDAELGAEGGPPDPIDEAAETTKARAPAPAFHEASTMALPKPAGKQPGKQPGKQGASQASGFHEARTQLTKGPAGPQGPSFFELPTEQLGKIHDEATDLQIATPESSPRPRRPPSASLARSAAPPAATRLPSRDAETLTPPNAPTRAIRSPRARWPLLVAAIAVGLLVAAAVLALMLREAPRRLELGAPLEHGPWRLVLIGAEEGLNSAGKPALRVSLKLQRPGQVMRASDVQLLLLDARRQAHAPYELKRLMANAELGQSGLWRVEYRLWTSAPYRLRFAPPGEPAVDFELVMPAPSTSSP